MHQKIPHLKIHGFWRGLEVALSLLGAVVKKRPILVFNSLLDTTTLPLMSFTSAFAITSVKNITCVKLLN